MPRHLVIAMFVDPRCHALFAGKLPGKLDVVCNHTAVFVTDSSGQHLNRHDPESWTADNVAALLETLRQAYAQETLQLALAMAARQCEGNMLEYYRHVRDLTAVAQAPIFARFGMPNPPAGVALLRKVCGKFENLADPQVLRLSKLCRELLDVDRPFL